MADAIKDIETEMDEIKMLMKIWNNFYRILTTTFFDDKADIKKLDPEFQKIKQIVAEHHSHFMKVIKKDFHIGQSVLTTVKRTISLEGFSHLSELEIRKTLIEWHDANILLNETVGALECQRDRILRGRKTKVPDKSAGEKAKEFFQSGTVKLVINLAILGAIVGVIYIFWEPISTSPYYIDYAKPWVDWLLGLIGMAPAEEAAKAGG